MIEGRHDETLLRLLRKALRARRAVPPEFVQAGRNAFAWHGIDVELAQLSQASAGDAEHAEGPLTETACLRTLTFTAARLTVELEVGQDCLIGQIIPAQPAVLTVQASARPAPVIRFDEHGCFIIQPIPRARFRLHCTTAGSAVMITRWISLGDLDGARPG